ncbi:MAG: hypothetical protein WEB88_11040, partial [Gemmatimonadota bacterium]
MRLTLPSEIDKLRPERPQLLALVALLAVSFVLTLGLAWQAWDAGRGEKEAAEAILARNVRSAAEEWAFWTHYAMRESFVSSLRSVFSTLDAAPASIFDPDVRQSLNSPPLPPGTRAKGADVVLLSFGTPSRSHPDSMSSAFVAWMREAIMEDHALSVGGRVVSALRADVPFGTGYLVYAGRIDRETGPTHAVVYWLDTG